MNKEFFSEVNVVSDENMHEIKLTYYLLSGSVSREYCDLEVYGVEIDKETVPCGKSGKEKKQIKNLFFKRSEAVNFLEKISRNKVTPMELKYVIKEYIDDQIDAIVASNG